MRMLSEEELVKSIAEQTERSAAVIGQTELGEKSSDQIAVIVSSLANIFDSALIVTALEDTANDPSECYRNARKLVLNSPAVSSEIKNFIRQIDRFRSEISFEADRVDNDRFLDFLNSYDCFMFQFFRNSKTVGRMKEGGSLESGFVSFRNIVEKLLRKEMLSSVKSGKDGDIIAQLNVTNKLLERIIAENSALNQKVSELSDKLDKLLNAQK